MSPIAQQIILLFSLVQTTVPIVINLLHTLISVLLSALRVPLILLSVQPKDNVLSVIQSAPLVRLSTAHLIHVHVHSQILTLMARLAFHAFYLIIGTKTT
jgi:hypothetical protein